MCRRLGHESLCDHSAIFRQEGRTVFDDALAVPGINCHFHPLIAHEDNDSPLRVDGVKEESQMYPSPANQVKKCT
jgi:hypothetical protein